MIKENMTLREKNEQLNTIEEIIEQSEDHDNSVVPVIEMQQLQETLTNELRPNSALII